MSIKNVKAGEYIGYADYYLAKDDMIIGTVPVGYAQGYGRSLTNNAWVLLNGEYAEVIGVINMNIFQIDLTPFNDAKIGDVVTLIGQDNGGQITITSFSDKKSVLNYEILTRIAQDVPRKVVD